MKSYFWPKPSCDYASTLKEVKCLEAEGRAIAEAHMPWNDTVKAQACTFAKRVFEWGHVPQKNVTAEEIERVLNAALSGNIADAPMNSGWTKVAALATAHLEAENRSQAIWDSRVSWSLVRRIDDLLARNRFSEIPPWLRYIGKVPGRGGTRWSNSLKLNWPGAYRRWDSQIAATNLIRELRDELNRRGIIAPGPYGEKAPWTVRSVEMVLFMDGY